LFQGLGGEFKGCFLQVNNFAGLLRISKIFLATSVLLRFQIKIITQPYALDLKLVVTEEENRV